MMRNATTIDDPIDPAQTPWTLPYRGTVGMACLIVAESAIFIIFVVAYIFYIGKSLSGPTPAQVLELPILGTGFRMGEFIAVDRSGNAADAKQSVAAAERVLAKGVHITTFVEGTRSPDGRMLPFKKGPFFLAMDAGAPCIPVSIHGTESIMGKGSLRIKPGVAHVVFHDPIDPTAFSSRDELMQAVRASIASGLPERMRN